MKEATKLRNALMKTLCLKADMTNATAGAEDSVNTRIISPICIMDIAYGIWQEHVLATMNPQGEVKACSDVIKRIMGFGSDYTLIGTQAEQKKYIGNAVEVNMAMALCYALYKEINQAKA